ncbi:DUF4062 domain-containing protein [uncultured Enterovirga sp.]|uniref:DUF4062 domain-containing protein n=1 Tax=uncultured Enterovirga sp. TaxID=2026352 RepID=UPI0035CB8A7D
MKVFVSSRFTGMEAFRVAACTAIRDLFHEPITVEDFPARAQSPRVACLDGVRQSGLVVLILGASYGDPQQPSGLSATHEEFREARESRDVLAFVQEGVDPEPAQAAFIKEVSDWSAGALRRTFRTPEELRGKVTGAISQWQLARAAGPVNETALVSKAKALIPAEQRNTTLPHRPRVVLTIASGPAQAV